MRRLLFAFAATPVAAVLIAAPASAAMTVGAFVTRASVLRANPLTAIASPDFATLRSEAQAAAAQLKAEREARRAAGKPPIACPPAGQSIGMLEMLDGLAALPAADQRLPLKDGYAKVIARRFPCR
ncbi:hypothetical protein [Sphingomonas sp.]|uniref:hypothetical protein n=1 Tax=Sphingomonas sp. TaxID=28214 RepID=UPI003AFFFC63